MGKVSKEINSTNSEDVDVFGWEKYHKTHDLFARRLRKIQQWIIDEITFIEAGILALIAFREYLPKENSLIHWLWWLEIIVLIILGIEIFAYAIPAIFSSPTKNVGEGEAAAKSNESQSNN